MAAARRFVRDSRQGAGQELTGLLHRIEAAILRGRFAAAAAASGDEGAEDALIVELAELRARLGRIESLIEQAGMTAIDATPLAIPTFPHRLEVGEKIDAQDYLPAFNGFYPAEVDPSGAVFRWTGPSHEFVFDIELDRTQPMRFVLRLLGAIRPEQCTHLGLLADGMPLKTQIDMNKGVCTIALVLPARPGSGRATLVCAVPRLYRPMDLGDGDDARLLGVRFNELKMIGG